MAPPHTLAAGPEGSPGPASASLPALARRIKRDVAEQGRSVEGKASLTSSSFFRRSRVSAAEANRGVPAMCQGISLKGPAIAEPQDTYVLAYYSDASVKSLLSCTVPRPDWAGP